MWEYTGVRSKVSVDFPSVEEASSRGNMRERAPRTQGHWTKEEDEILIAYIAKYGKGNWNSIHKLTGLARCGKSCRLRWANHLRPGLKKGPFTPEEEALVIELHAKIGTKWSLMAAEMPGRSDNDIKNFWNMRQKRLRRLGLLVDNPNVSIQDKRNKEPGASSSANPQPDDLLPSSSSEIPAAEFNSVEPSQQQCYSPDILHMVASSFPDIPGTSLLDRGLNTSNNTHKSDHSTVQGAQSLLDRGLNSFNNTHNSDHSTVQGARGSESRSSDLYADLFQTHQNAGPLFAQPLGSSSPYPSLLGEIQPSSSEPKWPNNKQLEVPSIQTPMRSLGSPSSLLQSSNILIQSPPNDHIDSGSLSLSPRNSGLLDAVIFGSQKSNA